MSRIKEAFKDGKALIGFLTAGVPSAEDTLKVYGRSGNSRSRSD